MNTRPQSLVDRLIGHVGLPRLAFGLAVACLLVLLLAVAIFAVTDAFQLRLQSMPEISVPPSLWLALP